MTIIPIITCAVEGGYYSPNRDVSAPIRIYKDRRIQDDIVTVKLGLKWRNRLTRNEFRQVKRAAKMNRASGLV